MTQRPSDQYMVLSCVLEVPAVGGGLLLLHIVLKKKVKG